MVKVPTPPLPGASAAPEETETPLASEPVPPREPAVMVVVPVKVLAPLSSSRPEPFLTRVCVPVLPAEAMTPP